MVRIASSNDCSQVIIISHPKCLTGWICIKVGCPTSMYDLKVCDVLGLQPQPHPKPIGGQRKGGGPIVLPKTTAQHKNGESQNQRPLMPQAKMN